MKSLKRKALAGLVLVVPAIGTAVADFSALADTIGNITALMPSIGSLVIGAINPWMSMALGMFVVGFLGMLLSAMGRGMGTR